MPGQQRASFFPVKAWLMHQGQSYKLKTATLGILSPEDGQRISMTVPVGATVIVVDGNVNGNRFVDVTWGDKALTMFAVDLRERGKLVRATDA